MAWIGWFWNTNWLIFEIYPLLFIILVMVATSFFTPQADKENSRVLLLPRKAPNREAKRRQAGRGWIYLRRQA